MVNKKKTDNERNNLFEMFKIMLNKLKKNTINSMSGLYY